jgi:hypothetical protein
MIQFVHAQGRFGFSHGEVENVRFFVVVPANLRRSLQDLYYRLYTNTPKSPR